MSCENHGSNGCMADRWAARRRRSEQLQVRYPHAAPLLELHQALLAVQERAFAAALDERPGPASLPAWVAERVAPAVAGATAAHGPLALAAATRRHVRRGDTGGVVAHWLAGDELPPADCYLARAAAGPAMEALAASYAVAAHVVADERHCPWCGGPPQAALFDGARDALVTAPRRLQCAHCSHTWVQACLTCPACGESSPARLTIYSETARFPHLRADTCQTCHRYLLTVDLRRDSEAVAEVDELAALPLDQWVQQRGFRRIAPNLMGVG